jgi:CheY-like chemotaxis protein
VREAKVILVVEDNPDDVALTVRELKKNGLADRVVVAPDGQEALDYLFKGGAYEGGDPRDMPHVVLLDLKLPRVDGLEVLRRMRADNRGKLLPVVVLTSSTEERNVAESYGLGANSYISKPLVFEQFTSAVKELGMYWLILNQSPRQGKDG